MDQTAKVCSPYLFSFSFPFLSFFDLTNKTMKSVIACGCGAGDNGGGSCDSSGNCTCKSNFADNKCTTCSPGYYLSGTSCLRKSFLFRFSIPFSPSFSTITITITKTKTKIIKYNGNNNNNNTG